MKEANFFNKVYKLVRKVPSGKVVTYGQIAEALKTRDARKIGWALHANFDPNTPCHRVVNKEGRLAPHFAFDGEAEQKRRLLADGVGFTEEGLVDLKRHGLKGFH
jgi:methylated-DNA-protein-cysteine methyltransferase-like protein